MYNQVLMNIEYININNKRNNNNIIMEKTTKNIK